MNHVRVEEVLRDRDIRSRVLRIRDPVNPTLLRNGLYKVMIKCK